jgi:hypothetical protein
LPLEVRQWAASRKELQEMAEENGNGDKQA